MSTTPPVEADWSVIEDLPGREMVFPSPGERGKRQGVIFSPLIPGKVGVKVAFSLMI